MPTAASDQARQGAKRARLEARITAEQKALFERAAALTGRSLTDFVVSSAHEAALRTLRDREVMVLSPEDSKAFVEALLGPPVKAPRLREAFRRYKDMTGDR